MKWWLYLCVTFAVVGYASCSNHCYKCYGRACEEGYCTGERCFKLVSTYGKGANKTEETKYGCISKWSIKYMKKEGYTKSDADGDCVVVLKDKKLKVELAVNLQVLALKETRFCACNSWYCNSAQNAKVYVVHLLFVNLIGFWLASLH